MEEEWNSIVKMEILGPPRNSNSVNLRYSAGTCFSNNHPDDSKAVLHGPNFEKYMIGSMLHSKNLLVPRLRNSLGKNSLEGISAAW